MSEISKINQIVQHIKNNYNGDFDLVPSGPRVTSTDIDLMQAIDLLNSICQQQQKRIIALEGQITGINSIISTYHPQ